MLTENEQYVIDLIKNLNAVVKIVSASPNSSRCLDHMLAQLAMPSSYRPVKNIGEAQRHRFYNPRTGNWNYRAVEDNIRGAPKQTLFTKKNSVSLCYLQTEKCSYFVLNMVILLALFLILIYVI